jgi:hypothetical protein
MIVVYILTVVEYKSIVWIVFDGSNSVKKFLQSVIENAAIIISDGVYSTV